MRLPSYLTLALVPAALVAQAPAATDYMAILKAETPHIDEQLKAFQPLAALAKAEGLLPATLPAFDKSGPGAALKSSLSLSGLTRLYLLTAKAAGEAGDWEKVLDLCTRAQACAKVNYEGTKEMMTPVIESWNQAMERSRKYVTEGADHIDKLKAKPGRTPQEEQELQGFLAKDKIYRTSQSTSEKNDAAKFLKANLPRFQELQAKALEPSEEQELKDYKVAQDNLVQGPKTIKSIQDNIDATKAELDSCPGKVESTQKNLKQESDEITKGIAETKINGKLTKETSGPKYDIVRAKYFENVLKSPVNYTSRPAKLDKLNFLFRLRHNVAGTALATKVDEVIDRVRQDQDPLPAEKKAGKKGKKA